MFFKNFLFVIIIFVSVGCGVSDIRKDLPNKYLYSSESSEMKWIMNNNSKSIDSEDYIPCKIEKYAYDQRYIIAKIKFHYNIDCPVGFKESKVLKEGKIYYYILDTLRDQRYGPFIKKSDFMLKKKELGIELEL